MATKEETDGRMDVRSSGRGQSPSPLTLVCPRDAPSFQEASNVRSETWEPRYMLAGGKAGRGQKCENRWKCNFLMTAADGKKTQECVRTMSEPLESTQLSRDVHHAAGMMAPLPNPGGQ